MNKSRSKRNRVSRMNSKSRLKDGRKVKDSGKVKDYIGVLVILSIGLLFLGIIYSINPAIGGHSIFGNSNAGVTSYDNIRMDVTYENLPAFLMSSAYIKDLPASAAISLEIGERSYIINKDSVEPGKSENADMNIYLPAGYLKVISEKGLCGAVALAASNGDLWADYYLSEFELAWKYRGMFKHKKCIR